MTALGGGYLASGPADAARLPRPYLPAGLRLDAQEGAGEVQTPLLGAAADRLALGDRVYMRHAKAGELCERFDEPAPARRRADRRARCRPTAARAVLPVSGALETRLDGCCARSSRRSRRSTARRARPASARRPSGSPRGCARSTGVERRARGRAVVGDVPADVDAARPARARRRGARRCAAAARRRAARAGGVRGHRRRGAERAAASCAGWCAAGATTVNVVGARGRSATAIDDARRARAPRRAADGAAVRPDAAAARLHERAPRACSSASRRRCRSGGSASPAPLGDARRRAHGAAPLRRARASRGRARHGAVADIWRSETVQGANDNLSGVAALVALARAAARRSRSPGLRVLLVSLRRRGDAAGRHPRVRRPPRATSSTRRARRSSTSTRSARRTS